MGRGSRWVNDRFRSSAVDCLARVTTLPTIILLCHTLLACVCSCFRCGPERPCATLSIRVDAPVQGFAT